VIFVTVGTQSPFDRLVRAVDSWASSRAKCDVFAQIAAGAYVPKYIPYRRFIGPPEFKSQVLQSEVVVAHAGMGSIILALELGKPIVVMPRRAHLRETRSDHQVHAAKHFGALGRVVVALDEHELPEKLDDVMNMKPVERINSHASPQLIATIRSFVEDNWLCESPNCRGKSVRETGM
jgi:UDP-N-acetylglucosamine transferase subunit ALG13